VINDQTDLLNVVKSLGEYLTSEESALRGKGLKMFLQSSFVLNISGVEFLSLVLAKVHQDKVNRQSGRRLHH